jgi:HlyD family secretion protein
MTGRRVLLRRIGFAGLAIALLAALAWVFMRSGPLAPTRVTVQSVGTGVVQPALFGIGTVEARRAYMIGPTAAGRVLRVLVDVGETVKAGQLLAEMDPVDIDERLAALDASIARAGSGVAAMEAQRRDALARQELAAINARRYTDLGEKNFVSPGVVEGKLQEQVSAEAGASGAAANLAGARQDITRLDAERAGLRQLRANVRLLAPADGVVTAREAEAGSTVVAGQAVLRVVDPATLWLKVRFDQGRSQGLAAGLKASVALRSNPGQALAGQVLRVEAVSDSVTEERVAQVGFGKVPAGVSIGELAEVTVALAPSQPSLIVPNASVTRQGDRTGVWRIEAGKLAFAPLRVGLASLDGQVQVLDGLKAGDSVVVYSEKALQPGSRIQVVDSLAERPR